MSGKTNRGKALPETPASARSVLIMGEAVMIGARVLLASIKAAVITRETAMIGERVNIETETAMIGDRGIIESLGAIMNIVVTENARTTKAAITDTTSIKGTDTNITAIGAHGTSGTDMQKGIPTSINTAVTTVTTPI